MGAWSSKEGFEVRILGLYLGFWSLEVGVELGSGGLGFKDWGLRVEGLGFEFRKI